MILTKNISLAQCVKSSYAIRHNIDNAPGKAELDNLVYLAEQILQPLYSYYGEGITLNSVYRCKKLNDALGSSDASLHLKGCAADIDSGTIPLIDILSTIYKHLPFTELIAEYFPGGWVHAGIILGREKERKLRLKDVNNNYKQITFEHLISLYDTGGKE